MQLNRIKTYYILDLWADAPPEEGFGYMVRILRIRGYACNRKAVKREVYVRLVKMGLIDPDTKMTARLWKQCKRAWKEQYGGNLTE